MVAPHQRTRLSVQADPQSTGRVRNGDTAKAHSEPTICPSRPVSRTNDKTCCLARANPYHELCQARVQRRKALFKQHLHAASTTPSHAKTFTAKWCCKSPNPAHPALHRTFVFLAWSNSCRATARCRRASSHRVAFSMASLREISADATRALRGSASLARRV